MKKRLAFVWDWTMPILQLVTWQDGLAAAVRELHDKFEVKVYCQMEGIKKETIVPHPYFPIQAYPDYQSMQEQVVKDQPELVLFWADMTRPAIDAIATRFPSAICFAGGQLDGPKAGLFKHIFVESKSYYEEGLLKGLPVSLAFGVNTQLFQPKPQPKVFEVFFPACFAAWKRHDLFADSASVYKSYACGWFQAHEPWCYESCQKAGIFTTHHMPHYLLPDFYNSARVVLITSAGNGGSQRSVLEAMACNIPCIVMADSNKTSQYLFDANMPELVSQPNVADIRKKIDEWKDKSVTTRDFVLQNYSEFSYAEKLYQGLCALVS